MFASVRTVAGAQALPLPRILVVEDDAALSAKLANTLTNAHMRVFQTASGIEGLKLFRQERPDIVIYGIDLNDMNGHELCRTIRTSREGLQTPILVMIEQQEEIEEAYEVGATESIPRHYHDALLIRRIRNLLQSHQAYLERQQSLSRLELLETLLDNTHYEIYFIDTSCLHIYSASKAAQINLGYSERELCQMDISSLLAKPAMSPEEYRRNYRQLARGEVNSTHCCAQLRRKNGSHYQAEGEIFAVRGGARKINIICLLQDSSQRNHTLSESTAVDCALDPEQATNNPTCNNSQRTLSASASDRDSGMHFDIAHKLQQALAENRLSLQYQPRFTSHNRQLCGFEAQLYWCGNDGRALPLSLTGIANAPKLIHDINHWQIREACHQLQQQCADNKCTDNNHIYAHKLTMAVSLAPCQLLDKQLPETLAEAFYDFSIEAECLQLEIADHKDSQYSGELADALWQIRSLGCEIILEHFDCGSMSMHYLQQYPIDGIKLDRKLTHEAGSKLALSSVVTLANDLHLKLIAEGINDGETLNYIRKLKLSYLQNQPDDSETSK